MQSSTCSIQYHWQPLQPKHRPLTAADGGLKIQWNVETPLQTESLLVNQIQQRTLCLLCKSTSIINGCTAALSSSVLYLRYGCSLLSRAAVFVIIMELLAFIIILYPCWLWSGHLTIIENQDVTLLFICLVNWLNLYLSRKASLFYNVKASTGSNNNELQTRRPQEFSWFKGSFGRWLTKDNECLLHL